MGAPGTGLQIVPIVYAARVFAMGHGIGNQMTVSVQRTKAAWRSELPVAALVAGLFLLTILVSSRLETEASPVSALRVGGAIVLGVLLRRRPEALGIYLLLTALAAFTANMLADRMPLFALGASAIRAGEIALAYLAIRSLRIHPEGLLDVRALAYTGAIAVGAVPLLGGIAGGLLLDAFYGIPRATGSTNWALGNAMGMLVLLPVMLAWTPERWARLRQGLRLRRFVSYLLVVLAVTVLAVEFAARPFILISLPLILVALRVGLLGTTIVCALNILTIWFLRGSALHDRLGLQTADFIAALGYAELNVYSAITVLAPLTISVILVDRMRSAHQLAESRQRMQTITDNVPALIGYLDADGRYTFVNRIYGDWFGLPPSGFVGRTPAEMFGAAAAADFAPFLERAMGGETVRFERELPDGRQAETSLIPDTRQGRINGIYLMSSDISARKALEESLRLESLRAQDLAQRDHLTGLPNRRSLEIRLGEALALAQRDGHSMAVLFMDLDGFKPINDALGHDAGDHLLKQVASRLASGIRTTDTAARLGGDEFVVVLAQIRSTGDARQIAEKLLSEIRAPFQVDGHDLRISLSIGIALYPDHGRDAASLMKHADAAMYRAKAEGRGRCSL